MLCGAGAGTGGGVRGWRAVAVVQDDSSTHFIVLTLFLFLLHQLQLRSASIRHQRLGTPGWMDGACASKVLERQSLSAAVWG